MGVNVSYRNEFEFFPTNKSECILRNEFEFNFFREMYVNVSVPRND